MSIHQAELRGAGATTEASAGDRLSRFVLPMTMFICTVYLWSRLHMGWLPEDDGLLGQGALRVLRGQRPHVDYMQNYTGGLDYFHALMFRLFGVNAFSMRIGLLLITIMWLAAVYYIASRFVNARVAGLVTLLAFVWSTPVYPASMPSWYNMFFATFGAAALFRYLRAKSRWWLLAAGLAGGLSIGVKIIGFYYIAAVLLFFIFHEQEINAGAQVSGRALPFRAIVTAGLLLFVIVVFKVAGGHMADGDFAHFLVPSMSLVTLLLWREFRSRGGSSVTRLRTLIGMAIPFLIGCALPLVLVLVPYVRSGTTRLFAAGLLNRSMELARNLAVVHADLAEIGISLLPVAILIVAKFWKPMRSRIAVGALCVLFVVTLIAGFKIPEVAEFLFYSASMITPVVVVLGCVFLARFGAERENETMLLVSLAGVCSLVQFPFPGPVYFCYVAPLVVLAIVALVSTGGPIASPASAGALLLFYLAFAVFVVVPAGIYAHASFQPTPPQQLIDLPRAGGIRGENGEAYTETIRAIQSHANGNLVIATPECPDIYFFAGLDNPTRSDGRLRPEDILDKVTHGGVNLVVLNQKPFFSPLPKPELIEQLSAQLPNSATYGKYLVMWR